MPRFQHGVLVQNNLEAIVANNNGGGADNQQQQVDNNQIIQPRIQRPIQLQNTEVNSQVNQLNARDNQSDGNVSNQMIFNDLQSQGSFYSIQN